MDCIHLGSSGWKPRIPACSLRLQFVPRGHSIEHRISSSFVGSVLDGYAKAIMMLVAGPSQSFSLMGVGLARSS